MKALAWDDACEPTTGQDLMSLLRVELAGMTNGQIDVEIHQDPNAFVNALNSGQKLDFSSPIGLTNVNAQAWRSREDN